MTTEPIEEKPSPAEAGKPEIVELRTMVEPATVPERPPPTEGGDSGTKDGPETGNAALPDAKPRRSWLDWLLGRPGAAPSTGIVLKPGGAGETVEATVRFAQAQEGTYVVRSEARFWLDRPIPAGWVTLWAEGNPEPLTLDGKELEAGALTAENLEFLLGSVPARIVLGALQGRRDGFQLPNVWVLMAVGLGLLTTVWLVAKKLGWV